MRRTVLAVGVAAVVVLGGVPAAGVLAASGGQSHHASPSTAVRDDDATSEATEAKQDAQQEAREAKREAKQGDKEHGRSESGHAGRMVKIAKAHRAGMKAWSTCVRSAATAGKANPTRGCVKPLPPGWVKHPEQHKADARPGSGSHERD